MMALTGSLSLRAASSGLSMIHEVPSPRPNPLVALSSKAYDLPSGDRSLDLLANYRPKKYFTAIHLVVDNETVLSGTIVKCDPPTMAVDDSPACKL